MIPFNETQDMTKYEINSITAGGVTYTFKLERSPAPFTQIRVIVYTDGVEIGRVSLNAALDAQNTPLEERWDKFMTDLNGLLSNITLGDAPHATVSEVETIWNRIVNLVFKIVNNKIIAE